MAPNQMRRLWLGFLTFSLLLTAVLALVPDDSPIAKAIKMSYSLMSITAMIIGIRFNRPTRTLPWFLLLATLVLGVVGFVFFLAGLARGELTFPSVADIFWLARYPTELAGLMLLVHGLSWRRDRAGILDTLMVTVGLGLGVWLLFLTKLVEDPALSWNTRLVAMAYPLADLLLLAGVIRMCISSARRSAAFWQLTAAIGVQSLGHAAMLWLTLNGTYRDELTPVFILSTMLLGGAALHPSMAAFGVPEARPAAHVTPMRVALIGSACLVSPVLLIVEGLIGHGPVDWLAASICSIAVFVLVIVRMTDLLRTVQRQSDQLESMAYLDGLTGIPNRRAWDAELERRLAVARRAGSVLIVGIIDIDHFKRYNDVFGHPAGDALLQEASAAWKLQLRPEDLIARYGGEEFGLILHCRLRDAAIVMERLREATPEGQTFSAGLALWTGDESAQQLTARADAALYAAKREGRDQFSVIGHPARTDLAADYLAGAR